jgi:hypothetical protein
MDGRPRPWHEPETGVQLFRLRCRRIWERWRHRLRLRRTWRRIGTHGLWLTLAGGSAWLLLTLFSPWPPATTVRHLIALPHCALANAVGLANAPRGRPGYWSHHDLNKNGIACEQPTWRFDGGSMYRI